jgi:putative transposase
VCRKCANARPASGGEVRSAYGVRVTRPLRSDLPDGFFHVTARGVDGTWIVRGDDDRRIFFLRLADVISRFDWVEHALCLMNTHYHLVLEATRLALSTGMKRLNGLYAQGFNERYERKGHLFGDRFWAGVIESEDYLEAACSYVIWNPVRAGLCDAPEDWPWSRSRYGFGLGR